MSPLSLPTNTRLPSTAGCERAELTPAKPNAHFSFIRGSIGAVTPPVAAGEYRLLATPAPHPFQPVRRSAAVSAFGVAVQRPTVGSGAAVPTARPVRNADTARRSASVNADPCRNMLPVVSAVRIVSGASCASAARLGARESAAGFWWQFAQAFSKTAAPSGACARAV